MMVYFPVILPPCDQFYGRGNGNTWWKQDLLQATWKTHFLGCAGTELEPKWDTLMTTLPRMKKILKFLDFFPQFFIHTHLLRDLLNFGADVNKFLILFLFLCWGESAPTFSESTEKYIFSIISLYTHLRI